MCQDVAQPKDSKVVLFCSYKKDEEAEFGSSQERPSRTSALAFQLNLQTQEPSHSRKWKLLLPPWGPPSERR